MTVKELIEVLKTEPEDAVVLLFDSAGCCLEIDGVTDAGVCDEDAVELTYTE